MSTISKRILSELRGDRVIWMIVAMLALFSILVVYSATGNLAYDRRDGDTEAYLVRHLFLLGLGLLVAYICYSMNYFRFKIWAPYFLIAAIPLLMLTLVFGVNINDARRWLQVPFIGITFQTSDFAKIALILFVAREITRHNEYIKDFNKAFLPIIMPVVIVCGLIAPADLSTALVLFLTCMLMMFIGRVDMRFIGLLTVIGFVVFAALIGMGRYLPDYIRVETWINRITDFVENPEGTFQTQHAKIAIANGGYFGEGPGNSIMRNYLPSPYADYVYAIILEEYGLIGGFVILALYVLLFVRTTAMVTKSQKQFGALAALGLSLLLVIQALANMAVAVHLVPVTGLPLPMISMGGTSLLFTCIAFGIILSVSRNVEQMVEQDKASNG